MATPVDTKKPEDIMAQASDFTEFLKLVDDLKASADDPAAQGVLLNLRRVYLNATMNDPRLSTQFGTDRQQTSDAVDKMLTKYKTKDDFQDMKFTENQYVTLKRALAIPTQEKPGSTSQPTHVKGLTK